MKKQENVSKMFGEKVDKCCKNEGGKNSLEELKGMFKESGGKINLNLKNIKLLGWVWLLK